MVKILHGCSALSRACALSLAVALACLAVPVAHAEEVSKTEVPQTQNPYISAVAELYEQGRYAEAQSRLEKALDWKSNGPQELSWLKRMKGVLQAELGQEGEALESFKEALGLDKQAQLPVQGNRRLRKLFEQARDTLEQPAGAEKERLAREFKGPGSRAVAGPPARRYGLSVGVRGEVDALGLSFLSSLTPAVSAGYTREKLGGVLTVLVQPSPGLRAEGQFHPLTLGWVRPYARLGATAFFGELDVQGKPSVLGGVGGRVALGMDVQWNSRMYAFADVSYEHFLPGEVRYKPQALLFSVGVGLFP